MVLETDKLKPGMRLLEDVVLPNGTILVNSRQPVTPSVIDALRRKGVTRVQVADPRQAEAAPDTPAQPAVPPRKTSTTPAIRVIPSDDGMSARLQVEPQPDSENRLTFSDVITTLTELKITHGINERAISGLVDKWAKLVKFYEVNNIAVGTPPQPGREGDLAFTVKHLSSDNDVEAVRQARNAWAITISPLPQRVDSGAVIAKREPGMPPVPGITIFGEPVFTEEVVRVPAKLDPSAALSDDGTQVIARRTGFAYMTEGGVIGVVDVNFDGSVEIDLADGNMKAVLTIRPAGERGAVPTPAQIDSLLMAKGVRAGVKQEALKQLYARLRAGEAPAEPVVVAEGTPPVNGENGRVEFLFNTESSLKPKQNPDGSVDYKNVEIIHSVSKGAELARLLPPTKGSPGMDVTGRQTPGRDGVPATLPMGPNTEVCPTDAGLLLAAVDGNVRLNRNLIEVSDGFVIKGNVDFSSGNVNYARSVTVEGDVCTGFSVDCGGDLQVNGSIDDAVLNVGGNVLGKYGFVGQGKGLMNAKGDVNLGFVKNQTIKCRGSVNVAKEALNAQIFARKAIVVHGTPLSVAGGTLMARDYIEVHTVGNFSGVRSNLEVGTDFTLMEELQKSEQQLEEVNISLQKILVLYKKYEQNLKMYRMLPAKDMELFKKLRESLIKHHQQAKALEQRVEMVKAKMHNIENAYVRILHSGMPGTLIKIADRHFLVKEEIIGPKTVRMINFEIKVL